jgi:hypothetical protein
MYSNYRAAGIAAGIPLFGVPTRGIDICRIPTPNFGSRMRLNLTVMLANKNQAQLINEIRRICLETFPFKQYCQSKIFIVYNLKIKNSEYLISKTEVTENDMRLIYEDRKTNDLGALFAGDSCRNLQ